MDLSNAHILFFLGSGVSTELPGVQEISCKVFTEPMTKYQGGPYVSTDHEIPDGREIRDGFVARILRFLHVLDEQAQHVLRDRGQDTRQVTYEDLYFLCEQIRDEYFSAANLAVRPYVQHIAKMVEKDRKYMLRDAPSREEGYPSEYAWIADEGCKLIRGVVRELLDDHASQRHDEHEHIVGFDCLRRALDASNAEDLRRLTIVTLNHDLVLEELMSDKNHPFKDGFDGRYGDSEPRNYDPSDLLSDDNETRLIKPHGSINWFYRENKSSSQSLIACNGDVREFIQKYRDRKTIRESQFISSAGKEKDYSVDFVGDMTEAFLRSLHDADVVIESGFGWNDKGMSDHLKRHLDQNRLTSLIHLHASPCEGSHLPGALNKSSAEDSIKAGSDRRFEDCTYNREQWLCSTPWGSGKKGKKGLKDEISKILEDTS